MYKFKSLKSRYSITIHYRLPDYTETEYKSKMVVEAKKEKDNYLFTLTDRLDVTLNNNEPEKVMDYLMMQLGNSLYPLELNVSPVGEFGSIQNFENVRDNWNKKAGDLLKNNPTDAFKKYIEMSGRNFVNERRLKKVLCRDTFIQLYFQAWGGKMLEIDCFNFPSQSRKTTYFAQHRGDNTACYDLMPAFLEKNMKGAGGILDYKLSDAGEIEWVKAEFYLLTPTSEIYKKGVTIEADKEHHRVKTGFFF